jgi:KaiC/GvpD/RAD55 family RecA-like ATPase
VPGEFLALVSLHHGHHNKTNENFGVVENSCPWQSAELPIDALIEHVLAGKAWTACQLIGGKRNADNASASNLIVLDIDGDIQLEAFWANNFAGRHCLLTYTSCSHNPDGEHRFRALFPCQQHADPALHRAIYQQLIDALGFQPKDASGEKPERLWYGNTNAQVRFGAGEPLSWDLVERARDELNAEQARRLAPRPQATEQDQQLDNERAAYCLQHLLRPSGDGEFNDYWAPLLNAAAATGSEQVRQAFFDWHHRGHHGKSQRGVEKRFDKAGTKITAGQGAGQILAAAKQQLGSDWWRQLPEHLWFGGGGGGSAAKPPTVLMRARSATDIAPAGGAISIPDTVPSAVALHQLAAKAQPTQLMSARPALEQAANHSLDTPATSAARMRELIILIYWLKIENLHRLPEGDQLLTETEAEDQIDEYTSELLNYPVFNRNSEKINLKLLSVFREQHGLSRRSRRNLKPEPLFADEEQDPEPLIGNLMALGCSYVLYARQGVGKTLLALLLCRAALGTPGHNRFLDFEPVPPQVWGSSRVLYVASDGNLQAKSDLRRYARAMNQQDSQWLTSYVDVLAASDKNNATRWRIDLFELHLLATSLDAAAAAGTPYRFVVIDSLKAVAPDGVRVGAQEIVDYVDLVDGICSPRKVTVLYIHHQAKEGDHAQGAAGLLEMVHGVFRLKQEEGQRMFCVDKTRLDPRGNREIPYRIGPQGDLSVSAHVADAEDDQGRELILKAFQRHYEKHVMRVAHLHKTDPSRSYSGISKSDYLLILRSEGATHSSWRNSRALDDIIRTMVKEKSLRRLKNQQVAIANAEAFTQVTSQQLQLKATAAAAEPEEDDDLPGWS